MIKKSASYQKWLDEHFSDLEDYLNNHVDYPSMDAVRYELTQKDPYLGVQVINDWLTNKQDVTINQKKLLNYIRRDAVFVILLLGMPDSGKTTTAYAIAEMIRDEYNIVHVAPLIDEGTLPDWIGWKANPFKLSMGEFAIIDEASIQNNARDSNSSKNKDDLGWLAVGRHVGAKMVYITQMSSIADINLTRWANIIISKGYGTSAAGASNIERQHMADNPILSYLKPEANYAGVDSGAKDWAVVTMAGETFMVYLPKPSFMNDKLSRSYMRYIERAGGNEKLAETMAMRDAQNMLDNEFTAKVIYQQMMPRGFQRPLKWWRLFTGEDKPPKGSEDD